MRRERDDASGEAVVREGHGLLDIEGGEITIIGNGTINATIPVRVVNDNAKLVIESGLFEGSNQAVYVNAGEALIKAGTYTGNEAVHINSGKATIENGAFTGTEKAVNVYEGEADILGGTFAVTGDDKSMVIDCYDTNYLAGTAKAVISGGRFAEFDPQATGEPGDDKDLTADTYVAIPEDSDYVVQKGWKVAFDTDGGSEVTAQRIKLGEKAVKPEDPTNGTETFAGWYTDENLTEAFDFDAVIEADTIVYARWFGSVKVGATLSLGESVDIVFYIAETSRDASHYTVEYSFAGGEKTTVALSEKTPTENGYRFVVAECAAKQMTDTVTFTVKYDGTEVYSSSDYSVQKYCDNKISNPETTEALKALCYAVLDYGASAQTFLENYNADKMANANNSRMAEVEASTIPMNWSSVLEGDMASAGIEALGVTLNTVSQTELVYYITPEGSRTLSDYEFSVEDTTDAKNDKVSYQAEMADGKIRLAITGIASRYLCDMYKLSITGNGNTYSVTYSPMTYASKKQNVDGGLGTLAKAMYAYGEAAKAFFES